jgi:hypothetical protein
MPGITVNQKVAAEGNLSYGMGEKEVFSMVLWLCATNVY